MQEELNNPNTIITSRETKLLIENEKVKPESKGLDSFPGEIYQTFNKIIVSFSQIEQEWTQSDSFYEVNVTLIKIQIKTSQEKYRLMLFTNMDTKILNKILINWIQQYMKKLYTITK